MNPMTAGLHLTHPGEILREIILPAARPSKAMIAEMLGISRRQLYDILNEKKPVTNRTALRLAKLFGGEAETWSRMQMDYDLRTEAEKMREELARIPVLRWLELV